MKSAAEEVKEKSMKEVEKKDLPGVTGGKANETSIVIVTPVPGAPNLPVGTDEPFDPLGDSKRHVEV
ncbi:MAG TPA: hypothetical protein VLT60_00295 [Usitatibacter sp.]|nr:hypothetical protein [Usitatibacter sp.]